MKAKLESAIQETTNWTNARLLGAVAYETPPPFSFVYGGESSAVVLPRWIMKKTSRQLDAQRTEHVVTYAPPNRSIELRCVVMQYHDFPTVEWTLYFKNTGTTDTPLIENIQALDAAFLSSPPFAQVHYWDGGYCGPNAYRPRSGSFFSENSMADEYLPANLVSGGRGSDRYLPYFNVERGEQGGLIIAIGWPGQWKIEFSDSQKWGWRVRAGQELTHFKLHPGEEARSPLMALQFWTEGDWIDAQNVWRRWMIAHAMPNRDGKPMPSQLAGCSSGYFWEMINANEENQKQFVDKYVAEKLGIDYWWMDAGWYPNNGHWNNTGTWEVDPKRFPKGLRAITDHAHKKGVKSIVWFEPERVTPKTWLWDHHPEWLLGTDPNNRLLNLGNPEARQWLTDHVDKLLTAQGIDLYRQDFNINPLPYWREADAPDRQGLTEIHYNVGYLAFWDELRRRHPGMLIDTCSSGGRRNDLETLKRSVPLLRSDDIGKPLSNHGHTYGFSMWVPYQGSGAPTDTYGFRSGLFWHTTIGPDARAADVDYEHIRKMLAQWRRVAPLLLGDFYPLAPYTHSESAWMAWQYDRPEQGDGLIQAFRRKECVGASASFRLRGLEANSKYRLENLDGGTQELTGAQLMETGLPVEIAQQPSAALIVYQRVDK